MAFAVLCTILFFFILVLLPLSSSAESYSNVTLGASLVADSTNSSWLSPSGDFAFGFQRIAPDGAYLLAIWFDKIPEKTIVWSANRGSPAEEGSKVQLLADGSLELSGPRGDLIWNVARSSGVAYGAMLDSGNFVLAFNASAIVWQSFEEPTNTLLPTQTLKQGLRLISDHSDTDYSMGRFVCQVQDGKLVFQSRNFPRDDAAFNGWEGDGVVPFTVFSFKHMFVVSRNYWIRCLWLQ